jgi:DNA polymerase III gamma/tau subunit
LTSDAQEGLLKILEDTPKNVYFMLATTNPASLKKTIITRATEIRVKLLTDSEIKTVINKAADAEKVVLPKDVLDKLVDVSEGSARKCLVILHQIIQLKTEDEQLQAIQKSESKDNAILLIRALLDTRTQWITIGNYLKSIEDEPETVRRIMLSYCSKILMGNSPMVSRAFLAIKSFQDHYYDSGKAGLCASCYSFWTLSKGKR